MDHGCRMQTGKLDMEMVWTDSVWTDSPCQLRPAGPTSRAVPSMGRMHAGWRTRPQTEERRGIGMAPAAAQGNLAACSHGQVSGTAEGRRCDATGSVPSKPKIRIRRPQKAAGAHGNVPWGSYRTSTMPCSALSARRRVILADGKLPKRIASTDTRQSDGHGRPGTAPGAPADGATDTVAGWNAERQGQGSENRTEGFGCL